MNQSYTAHLDEKTQTIVIEDDDGNVIASRTLPTTIYPYPGRNQIMGIKENLDAWQEVYKMVAATHSHGCKYCGR